MSLDLQFEEAYTAEEISIALKITEGSLTGLEAEGLPFIEVGDHHVYLTSSILGFLKKIEITEGEG